MREPRDIHDYKHSCGNTNLDACVGRAASWLLHSRDEDELWPAQADPAMVLRRNWGEWFAGQYRSIINLGEVRHARHDVVDR